MSRKGGTLIFITLFALDRFTKLFALFTSAPALTFNERAFFFFDDSRGSLVVLVVLVTVLGAWFGYELYMRASTLGMIASASIVAGALSNTLDRLRYGAIIDWIPLYGVSVYNLADVFIMVGCVLALVSFFRRKTV